MASRQNLISRKGIPFLLLATCLYETFNERPFDFAMVDVCLPGQKCNYKLSLCYISILPSQLKLTLILVV